MTNVEKVKKVITENYLNGDCGIFDTRNIVGDTMTTIFKENGITVDICYDWAYFEVFGLSREEFEEVYEFYNGIQQSSSHRQSILS